MLRNLVTSLCNLLPVGIYQDNPLKDLLQEIKVVTDTSKVSS